MVFPDTPLVVTVELAIGAASAWVDVTGWVYTRAPIKISRGLADEQSNISASTCSFVLNNRDGRFSPRNPVGPYFGIIGRNTRVRVKVDGAVRFYGEVAAWPVHWDLDGKDVWVSVECAGILRRLGQGSSPVVSPMRVGIDALFGTPPIGGAAPVAYWPMEESNRATSAASAVPGIGALTSVGRPKFADFAGLGSSAPLPTLQRAALTGVIPEAHMPRAANGVMVWFVLNIGSEQADGAVLLRLSTDGSRIEYLPPMPDQWDLVYRTANNGSFEMRAYDLDRVLIAADTFDLDNKDLNNGPMLVGIQFLGDPTLLDIYVTRPGEPRVTINGSAVFDYRVWTVNWLTFNPGRNLTDVAIGHVMVFPDMFSGQILTAELAGHAGELAGTRMARLCALQDPPLPLTFVGNPADTVAMGSQRPGRLLNLIQECADADLGALYEPRMSLGLAYRTRVSLYNQAPKATVAYGQLDQLEPVDDDQSLRNDVTVQGADGGEARATLDVGTLSTLDPPAGAGRYDTSVTVNVGDNDLLREQAGWRLKLGTVDETRYPVLHFPLAAEPTLITPVLTLDVGDVIKVTGLPAWLPQDPVLVLGRGFTETLEPFGYTVEVNCTPASPWNVAVVYDGVAVTEQTARYSPDSAVTAASMTTTATAMSSTNVGPRWTTSAADLPFDVKVTGEVMRVTAISTATPQVLTVTRSINGVVKTHAAGEQIALAYPAFYAL